MTEILLLGGSGLVGSRFNELSKSKYPIIVPTSRQADVMKPKQFERYLRSTKAGVVINCIAFTNTNQAEGQKGDTDGLAYQLNAKVAGDIARICHDENKSLYHLSTDYVFDGQRAGRAYTETDTVNPINWYAITKTIGEELVQKEMPDATIVRLSMPYRAKYDRRSDLVRSFISLFDQGHVIKGITDSKISPIFIDQLCQALSQMIDQQTHGIYHLGPTDPISPYDFARLVAEVNGYSPELVQPIDFETYNQGRVAPLVPYSWLDVTKFEENISKKILKSNLVSLRTHHRQIQRFKKSA